MPTDSQRTICRLLMASALLLFLLATAAMLQQREPFYTWFYSFAWWSYILFVESFLGTRGQGALLFVSPLRFLMLLPLSVTLWLFFEAYNFRLQNWHYLDLPPSTGLRWLGYTIAFATVLPAIFTTRDLLDHLGVFRDFRIPPLRLRRPSASLIPMGIAMLALPLLFPYLCFPAIWLGLIFLIEPLNYKYGADSILRDLEQGAARNLCLFLLSGLVCGVFWECWNFWAGSKWFYTIPYLGFFKIFEMPILGFLGFPPFAVECYVVVKAYFLLLTRMREHPNPRVRVTTWVLLGLVAVAFDIIVYLGIDAFTVTSFRGTQ